MRSLVGLIIFGLSGVALATPSHSVRGYVKRDGTYVAPHYQTNPNATRVDNWSSAPNVNPYTGKVGTADPFVYKPKADPQ